MVHLPELPKIPSPFKHEEPVKHVTGDSAAKQSRTTIKTGKDEQSLHTILPTPELRSALTLLIAGITTEIRNNLTAIFDPRFASTHVDALHDTKVNVSTLDKEELEKLQKRGDKITEELSRPELQDLKREALNFLDTWRESVLTRVGEVVNSKTEAKEQIEQTEKSKGGMALESRLDETIMLSAGKTSPSSGADPKGDKSLENMDVDTSDLSSSSEKLRQLYHPIATDLNKKLDQAQKALLVHSLLLLLLSLERYSSYSRILLLHVLTSLDLPLSVLAEDEANVARSLLTAVTLNADDEAKKKAEDGASSRKWKVGLATVAGAAVIGITGGLAAPLVAAGLGTALGGIGLAETAAAVYLGALAESTLVIGTLFGAYGGRMTGKMMDEYAKEVSDFGFVPVLNFHKPRKIEKEYRRIRVAIGISGWLTDKEDVYKPWRVLAPSIEGFALRWELEALLKLGNSITGLLRTTAWTLAKKEMIKKTVFGALLSALWPISLLKAARVVDNPFSVAKSRADKAGLILADALINKVQGERPVTIVGYSLGARLVYSCLMELARRRAFGLIESVVLLGAPAPSDPLDWRKIRTVVAGRLVNVHSENDYVLAFLYRTSAFEYGVAGLQKVETVRGIENVDVSDIVSGHLRYRFLSGTILKRISFEDLDLDLVEEEEAEMKAMEKLEEQEREIQGKKDEIEGKDDEPLAKDLEQIVEKKNEQSMSGWAKMQLGKGRSAVESLWAKNSKDEKD